LKAPEWARFLWGDESLGDEPGIEKALTGLWLLGVGICLIVLALVLPRQPDSPRDTFFIRGLGVCSIWVFWELRAAPYALRFLSSFRIASGSGFTDRTANWVTWATRAFMALVFLLSINIVLGLFFYLFVSGYSQG